MIGESREMIFALTIMAFIAIAYHFARRRNAAQSYTPPIPGPIPHSPA